MLVRASSYSSHIEMINKDIEKDEEARRKSTAGFMKHQAPAPLPLLDMKKLQLAILATQEKHNTEL